MEREGEDYRFKSYHDEEKGGRVGGSCCGRKGGVLTSTAKAVYGEKKKGISFQVSKETRICRGGEGK